MILIVIGNITDVILTKIPQWLFHHVLINCMVSHPDKTAVFPEGSCTEQPQAAAVTNCVHTQGLLPLEDLRRHRIQRRPTKMSWSFFTWLVSPSNNDKRFLFLTKHEIFVPSFNTCILSISCRARVGAFLAQYLRWHYI